jgi:hypothetical protein
MATSKAPKQPHFPHPPLEIGVPQYPTPNVPDFYTKNGHIILVVKESVEKGNYNPQPLDGSVTYTGRDANKWPSTLYLVYQRPTEDAEFVYNYYANDRTLASQDPWNYGLDYSANNPDYPITSRTYITPRSQYSTAALGSTDPVFGGSQIISQQKMVELPDDNPLRSRYVAVQRVYETIPGPVLTGEKLDERGDLETITTQTVAAGTAPDADGLLVTQTAVQPVDSVKSTKTKGTVSSYATLTTKANKSGLLGNTSTTDDIVAPSTNPDTLSTTVLESTVEALTATKSRKRTTTSSGPTSLGGREYKAGLLGETNKSESIVAAGSYPDQLTLSILDSSVEPIDAYKSKKTTITATGPTQLGGVSLQEFGIATTQEKIVTYGASPSVVDEKTIKAEVQPIDLAKSKETLVSYSTLPVISGYQYDDFFDANLVISRQLVEAGAAPTSGSNILSYKDEPVNPYQSQRVIVSRNGHLPPTRTEYKTGTYTSPLLVFGINVEAANLGCTSAQSDVRVKLTPVTRSAQSRQTIFKTITSYSYGPSETAGDADLFAPELKEIAYTGYVINFNLGGALCDELQSQFTYYYWNGSEVVSVVENTIPVHYCTAGGLEYPNVYESWDIGATTISATSYYGMIGQYKKISWEERYWKAGIYEQKEIQVKLI